MATDWSSLFNAPPPAFLGDHERQTLCENNAIILTSSSMEARNMVSRTLSKLPLVDVANGTGTETGKSLKRKSTSGGANAGSANSAAKTAKWAFLPPKQSAAGGPPTALAKLFWTMLNEEGLSHAVNELINFTSEAATDPAATNYHRIQSKFIFLTAKTFLSVYNFMTLNLYGTLRPAITMSAEELTEKFHPTRDWSSSSVRFLAWHPHTNKLAVALRDDSIHIYTTTAQDKFQQATNFVPMLKYKQQRGVTTMAWRPFYASELAVGCSSGVLVWTIDPSSVVARPSAGCVSLLQSPGHSPVNHVEWQPNGELLLSSVSTVDSSIILWNTASETGEVLRRVGILGNPGGFHLAQFSPDGRSLFAAHSTAHNFRMWSTSKWTQESWTVKGGSVQTACWSRDSSTLLYTVSNDCQIFCMRFLPDGVSAADEDEAKNAGDAVPVLDFQEVQFTNQDTDEVVTTGGLVRCMKWDFTGERLVISFVGSNLLALFQTQVGPANIALNPLGFISGETDDEWPSCFDFAPHFSHEGALLTIAWSTGRVQHFPMFFTAAKYSNNALQTEFMAETRHHLAMTRQLSVSHLATDQSINVLTDFEPPLFSGPAI